MRHRNDFNKLGRTPSHRKALHANMVTSLFRHERIRTSLAKAREVRRTAEKMITRARTDSVHNRRLVRRRVRDGSVLAKLFMDIAPRFEGRPGGYTRIVRLGQRSGDGAEVVLLELVVRSESEKRPKPAKEKIADKATET